MKQWVIIILFILSALTISSSYAQSIFDREGHRGGRGLMPENTISSMKKAVDLGVTLEMDISFTKEKLPIVSHDQYINSAFTLKLMAIVLPGRRHRPYDCTALAMQKYKALM